MAEGVDSVELVNKRHEMSSSKVQRPSTTRSSTEVWLVGKLIPVLDIEHFKQLPTAGQVLRRLFFDLKINKLSLSKSSLNITDEILLLWNAANIPTKQKSNIVAKVKALYQKHVNISKNRKRRTERQTQLENEFYCSLALLFDVSHADSEQRIGIKEDLQFLEDQRRHRKMAMAEEGGQFKKLELNLRQKRKYSEFQRDEKAKQRKENPVDELTTRHIAMH